MYSNGSSPGSGHYRRRGYSSWNRRRFQASTNQYTSSGFSSPQSRWTMTTEQGNSCGDHNNNNNAFSNVQYFGRNLTDMKAGYVGRSFDSVMQLGGDFGDQHQRYSAAGSKACGNNFEYSSRQGTNGKFWSDQISSSRDYHNWGPFPDGDGPGGALFTRNGSQHSFESSSTTVDKITMMENGNVGMDGVTFMPLQEHEHDYFPPKYESVRRKEGGKRKLLMALLNSDKKKENERKAGCEHFGLAGLACSLKTAETDPGLVTLPIGFDLAPLLGYDLCSTPEDETMWSSFTGPFGNGRMPPHQVDADVPAEFKISEQSAQDEEFIKPVREKLLPLKVSEYKEELLFYLFYNFPNDILQTMAACSLYDRDWRYHTEKRIWISRIPGKQPTEKGQNFERGLYCVFDTSTWDKSMQECFIEFDKLEARPSLGPS